MDEMKGKCGPCLPSEASRKRTTCITSMNHGYFPFIRSITVLWIRCAWIRSYFVGFVFGSILNVTLTWNYITWLLATLFIHFLFSSTMRFFSSYFINKKAVRKKKSHKIEFSRLLRMFPIRSCLNCLMPWLFSISWAQFLYDLLLLLLLQFMAKARCIKIRNICNVLKKREDTTLNGFSFFVPPAPAKLSTQSHFTHTHNVCELRMVIIITNK